MSTIALYAQIELLPEHLKQQVLDYIEFLLSREVKRQPAAPPVPAAAEMPPLKAGFGGAKGMFVMSPDFDEPLGEDFKSTVAIAKKPLKAGFLKGSFVITAEFDEPLEDFKEA